MFSFSQQVRHAFLPSLAPWESCFSTPVLPCMQVFSSQAELRLSAFPSLHVHTEAQPVWNSFDQMQFFVLHGLISYLNRQNRVRHCHTNRRGGVSSDHDHNFMLCIHATANPMWQTQQVIVPGIQPSRLIDRFCASVGWYSTWRMVISSHCHNVMRMTQNGWGQPATAAKRFGHLHKYGPNTVRRQKHFSSLWSNQSEP